MSDLNERKIVDALIEYLKRDTPQVHHFKGYVLRAQGFFPTQPEIDLILYAVKDSENVPPIRAAEVKYIRSGKDGRLYPSYYAGLDEALSLLVVGFDNVELIHVVEERSLVTVYLEHAKLLAKLVRNLELPIGYRVLAAFPSEFPIISSVVRTRAGEIDLKSFWVQAPTNPLLSAEDELGEIARNNRKILAKSLKIKLWQ